MSFRICYVTFPNDDAYKRISRKLLEEKLIACANKYVMESAYWWEGKIVEDEEVMGILKTRSTLLSAVMERIDQLHPYDVPCIIHWEAEANLTYEKWIHASTKPLK